MPKIRIITKYQGFRVYDNRKQINPAGMHLDLNPRELLLRIPLVTLGNPDFILTSVKTQGEKSPADSTGFRKIIIK